MKDTVGGLAAPNAVAVLIIAMVLALEIIMFAGMNAAQQVLVCGYALSDARPFYFQPCWDKSKAVEEMEELKRYAEKWPAESK